MRTFASFGFLLVLAACGDTTNNYGPDHPSDTPSTPQTVAKPSVQPAPVVPVVEPCPSGKVRKSSDERCDD